MNFNNFTIKSQEVIQKAVELTRQNGNQAIEPEHLLKAVLTQGDGVMNFVMQKLDMSPVMIERPLDAALSHLPRVAGGEPYLSGTSQKVLEKANEVARRQGDQYVTVEAIFMALFEVKSAASSILKDAGVTQSLFAKYFGVSARTVEAWEAGRNKPSGPSSRLLELLQTRKLSLIES